MDPFPYLDLLPELRRTIACILPRRTRVALQRACRTTHADDPGSFTPLDAPAALPLQLRAFVLRVFAEVIDAGLDLRHPYYRLRYEQETIPFVLMLGSPIILPMVVEFTWRGHQTTNPDRSLCDVLRVTDEPDGRVLEPSESVYVLPDAPYLLRAGQQHDARVAGSWNTDKRSRPLDAVASWCIERTDEATGHVLFHGTAWRLTTLERGYPWIGIFDNPTAS